MTQIVFKARDRWSGPDITKMEVERSTKDSVWLNGRRLARYQEGMAIYDDFDSAKEWVTSKIQIEIARLEKLIANRRERMNIAESISLEDVKIRNERY